MQRQIKFRALGTKGWNPTENNGWYFGSNNMSDYLGDNKKHQYSSLPFFFKQIGGNYFDKDTLSQFTGLLDKNRIEIYEGDVVKRYEDERFIVIFMDGVFYGGDAAVIDLIEYGKPYIEVIGNIHQNPELLKGATNVERD